MDILKHLKKLEDKIESIFEPGRATDASSRPAPDAATPSSSTASNRGPDEAGNAAPVSASSSTTTSNAATTTATTPVVPPLREPLELKKAILVLIEEEVRRIDGKPAFPFNRIDVRLWAPDARAEALLSAELIDGDRLKREVIRTLEALRVTPDKRLELYVQLVSDLDRHPELRAKGFQVECSREQETDKLEKGGARKGGMPLARLVVEQGTVESGQNVRGTPGGADPAGSGLEGAGAGMDRPGTVTLQKARVNLGRLAEVVDDLGRVVRRNEVAFRDEPGINATVSRMHAHVSFERETGEFRLFDDNSAEGTTLFREGRRIDVPRGQRRGIVLRDGDEIYLGQARIRFVRP